MSGLLRLYLLISLVISIAIHEFFHAWMANHLGDPTPKRLGRITLNPIAHLDIFGAIMILLSVYSGVGFGWGKPVPFNPYNTRRDPRTAMGIVGFAGPLSNLLLAMVFAVPLRFSSVPVPGLVEFLVILVSVNISLAVFNLLPLPPLDGYSVLMAILNAIRKPWATRFFQSLARIEAQGPIILLLIFMLDTWMPFSIIGTLTSPLRDFLGKLILG